MAISTLLSVILQAVWSIIYCFNRKIAKKLLISFLFVYLFVILRCVFFLAYGVYGNSIEMAKTHREGINLQLKLVTLFARVGQCQPQSGD